MPVNAVRFVRKMRGGAQAHLIEADDGGFYVVKFRNNPQHRRILVNEWIASVFLRYLGILTPETQIVSLSSEFLRDNPEVSLQFGTKTVSIPPGWHFGSRYPGHPDRIAVYDFLPDALLQKVENLDHFAGTLVLDKWMGNADARQSIFLRAQLKEWNLNKTHPARKGFVAIMIDHGYVFDGPQWTFSDSPLQGLYFRPLVYRGVRSEESFEPWLSRVSTFPEEVMDEAWRQIPKEWLDGDEDELELLLTKLLRRRKNLPAYLRDSAKARTHPFPDWR
ncbi:MAG: hypothetical protein HUU41_14995 [Bryobacteraceae bacterium]|nr:hypothetical protein [Bryobacterales bacterium]NUN02417.1 hypothetical protein [Bryobacteraceae bacterium]